MRAGRAIRQAVINRIKAEVSDLTAVYDRATESDEYPYVTLGPSSWVDASAECIDARSYILQIDVWCSSSAGAPDQGVAASGKGNAEDIVDDVSTALNGWMDQDAVTAHPARVTLVRVMDDPSGCVHGVVQVEVEAEELS